MPLSALTCDRFVDTLLSDCFLSEIELGYVFEMITSDGIIFAVRNSREVGETYGSQAFYAVV